MEMQAMATMKLEMFLCQFLNPFEEPMVHTQNSSNAFVDPKDKIVFPNAWVHSHQKTCANLCSDNNGDNVGTKEKKKFCSACSFWCSSSQTFEQTDEETKMKKHKVKIQLLTNCVEKHPIAMPWAKIKSKCSSLTVE